MIGRCCQMGLGFLKKENKVGVVIITACSFEVSFIASPIYKYMFIN